MEFLLFLAICACIYISFKTWLARNMEAKQKREFEARISEINRSLASIESLISAHSNTLARKYDQLFYVDDYGNPIADKWIKEVDYFIDRTLLREQVVRDFIHGAMSPAEKIDRMDTIADLIFDIASQESIRIAESHYSESIEIESLSGKEYEIFCINRLLDLGWEARQTRSTGDQGIDIIASIEGISAVFQCKKYSGRVGNSAVQEIISGRSFSRSKIAAVITNNTFTTSARQLAQAADVYLLHHNDLESFTQEIIYRLES